MHEFVMSRWKGGEEHVRRWGTFYRDEEKGQQMEHLHAPGSCLENDRRRKSERDNSGTRISHGSESSSPPIKDLHTQTLL